MIHFFLSFSAVREKSLTFDEPAHIVGGLDILINRSYALTPDNGVFCQIIEALPALLIGNIPSSGDTAWKHEDVYQVQKNILFANLASADSIICASRLAVAIFSILSGLLVYFIARGINGYKAGFISLLLYSFCPNIIAHSGFATSDLIVTTAFLLATWLFWKASKSLNVYYLLLAGVSLGLLCISKMSFFIIVPVYLCIIFIRLISSEAIEVELFGKKNYVKSQKSKLIRLVLLLFLNVIAAWLIIWAAYGLRFQAETEKSQSWEDKWSGLVSKTAFLGKSAKFARSVHILPDSFLYGFLSVYHYSRQRYSFLNGELSNNGFLMFFPYCFIVKTTLPMFLLLISSAWLLYVCIRKKTEITGTVISNLLYELSPYFIFVGIYFLFALSSRINIGHRHILPIYPPLFIISGCALSMTNSVFQKKGFKYFVFAMLAWHAIEGIRIFPNYLAYFNQLIGGPKNAYKHLVDSSLDWGQDLKTLGKWLEANPERANKTLYLSYFGSDIPTRFKISGKILPGYNLFDHENKFFLEKGLYAISATMLQFVYFPDIYFSETGLDPSAINDKLYEAVKEKAEKEINDFATSPTPQSQDYKIYNMLRFAKLCIYLKQKEPNAFAGYSILIFDLNDNDIKNLLE